MTKAAVHVGVSEAKTHLSRLLDRVLAGEEVVIDRRGEPVARLTAVHAGRVPQLGTDRGEVTIANDFDAPMPAESGDPLSADGA